MLNMVEYKGKYSDLFDPDYSIHYESRRGHGFEGKDFFVIFNGAKIAEAEFVKSKSGLHCNNIEVLEEHRRKGIANSLYLIAEELFDCKAKNVWKGTRSQSRLGAKLWSQKNRPFG
ncbi:hypothetical protein [Microbulbifer zhoushanensis]|uniref:hypothetical protein n=1 Tax=Microbulbifer zhoushanensis TaxID=2904254 RepID=UPI001F28EF0E|nr:hypothetical protein [Microbulbifer zhoushanensis]